jgi:hypothetical protein
VLQHYAAIIRELSRDHDISAVKLACILTVIQLFRIIYSLEPVLDDCGGIAGISKILSKNRTRQKSIYLNN